LLKKFTAILCSLALVLGMIPSALFISKVQADTATVFEEDFSNEAAAQAVADSLNSSGGNANFQKSGNAVFGISGSALSVVTTAVNDYSGLDIKGGVLNLESDKEYTITVTGSIGSLRSAPAQMQLQFLGFNSSNSPVYGRQIQQNVEENQPFSISAAFTLPTDVNGETFDKIRIKTNGQVEDFYIESIAITSDDAGGVTPPEGSDNYVLQIETTGGHQYDGVQISPSKMGLEAGGTYNFSFDVYTADKDVAFVLQTNKQYSWIANTSVLSSDDRQWTNVTGKLVNMHADDAADNAYIQIVKKGNSHGGQNETENIIFYIDNFIVTDSSGNELYKADFDDQQNPDFIASGDATLTVVEDPDSTGIHPTPPPPSPSPEPEPDTSGAFWGTAVFYDLSKDAKAQEASDGDGFTPESPLVKSGDNVSVNVKAYNGSNSLYVSGRTASYYGLDINKDDLKVNDEYVSGKYTITVTGHIDENEDIPTGAYVKIGMSQSPWGELASPQQGNQGRISNEQRSFELTYEKDFSASQLRSLSYGFRIQTSDNASTLPFYIDSLVVQVYAPANLSFTFTPEEKEKFEGWWRPGSSMDLEWVEGFGNGDNYSLKLTRKDGNTDYNASNSGVQVVFPTKLPAGQYHISADFYAPLTDGNYSNASKSLDEESILLNSHGGDANYRFPADAREDTSGGHIDEWVTVEGNTSEAFMEPINEIRFRYFGNTEPSVPNVFYLDNVKIQQSGDIEIEEWADPEWDLSLQSIKDAYKDYFLMGNILEPGQTTDEDITAMFDLHYAVVTAENAMKPDQLSRSANNYDYAQADRLIDWAETNGILVHGHTLVWHAQSPPWLNTGSAANRAAAKANMEDFITDVAGHFKGKVISWDVVNEAFENDARLFDGKDWKTGLRTDSPWYIAYANGADQSKGESGADYLYDAFVLARQADPNATLYYNDYNEEGAKKCEAISQMAEALNAQWKQDSRYDGRLLVEGIGMQSHYWSGGFDASVVEDAVQRFIKTGAKISVSELDIPMGTYFNQHNGKKLTKEQEITQATQYAQLFEIYKKYAEHFERVTFWGKADVQSWRASGMPLLFDNSFKAKEAYKAVIDPEGYLGDEPIAPPKPSPSITPSPTPSVTKTPSPTPSATNTPTPTSKPIEPPLSDSSRPSVNSPQTSATAPSDQANTIVSGSNSGVVNLTGNKDGASFSGSVLSSALANYGQINVSRDGFTVTIPGQLASSWNTKAPSELEIRLIAAPAMPKALSDTLTSINSINSELNKKVYDVQFKLDGTSLGESVYPYMVSVDVSNLTNDQKANLTGVVYSNALSSYKQLGGEISADGKTFTFYTYNTGYHGIILTDKITKIKLTINSLEYKLNGSVIQNDVEPYISDQSRTMLPLRIVAEAIGAEVGWNNATKTVTITKGPKTITLIIGQQLPNGLGAAEIKNDRAFVPLRYIAEQLDANVVWNASNKTVDIYQ